MLLTLLTRSFTVAHNCHGKRINLATKKSPRGKTKKPHGKKIKLTEKDKSSRKKIKPQGKIKRLIQECVPFFCAIEMKNEYDFYWEIID